MFVAADFVGKTAEEIQSMLEANRKAQTGPKTENGLKVSEKGAVSVYNLGRFPITLYASQWLALLDRRDEIMAFMVAHKDELKSKQPKTPAVQ